MLALKHCSENGARKKRRVLSVFASWETHGLCSASPKFWKHRWGVFDLVAAVFVFLCSWFSGMRLEFPPQGTAEEVSAAGSSRYSEHTGLYAQIDGPLDAGQQYSLATPGQS